MSTEHTPIPTSTPGPWVNGYGNGITGPTTPSGYPTCQESVNWHNYNRGAAKYPDSQHTVVSRDTETIAIIPLNGVGGEIRGEANARLIAAAPELLAACELAEATIERLNRHDSANGTLDVIRAALDKAAHRELT